MGAHRWIDYRDYALGLVDEGPLNARDLAIMAIKYMSQDDVRDMIEANELDPRSLEMEQKLNEFLTRNQQMDKCVICEEHILFNDGRNPWPLGEGEMADEGECCSFCDEMYVLSLIHI